ncbi:MAG: glutaredoxin family protein [Christensenellales bacterium]|nr:thioredoxin [Clostridiales bacterium]
MANITLYHFEGCPACGHAKEWMKELRAEKPELKAVEVEMVDVHKTPNFVPPEPFYYVPTFFVDGKKVLEGAVSKEEIEKVMRRGITA